MKQIPTYIINLKERPDRLKHAKTEFLEKPEFRLNVIDAIPDPIGALGLWKSVLLAIEASNKGNEDYLLICEDDHMFTQHYDIALLIENIKNAERYHADVLLGGVHWFDTAARVTDRLYWVDNFTATHFIVIYKRFYDILLNYSFKNTDDLDLVISKLSDRKFLLHPFISIQKDFGYSDIRKEQNMHSESQFEVTSSAIHRISKISNHFLSFRIPDEKIEEKFSVPTFTIIAAENSLPISWKVNDLPEFEIIQSFTSEGKPGSELGAIYSNIIRCAIEKEFELIVICGDKHRFTQEYDFEIMAKGILEGYRMGADIIFGGVLDYGLAVRASENLMWINQLVSSDFIIIFNRFFEIVLAKCSAGDSDFNPSALTDNKFVLNRQISFNTDWIIEEPDKSLTRLDMPRMLDRTRRKLANHIRAAKLLE